MGTLAQLPKWARDTLQHHALDRRAAIPLEKLARACSGNHAWDGMQRYLIETGELHNNARMGWGKALLKWTTSPEQALEALLHLNNRFALDGHAPPSYGGLLGCLGLFEGPKQEDSVVGKVSYKPPKGKYATMPQNITFFASQVPPSAVERAFKRPPLQYATERNAADHAGKGELFACSADAENSFVQEPDKCGDRGIARPFQQSLKRRWVPKNGGNCIDLT